MRLRDRRLLHKLRNYLLTVARLSLHMQPIPVVRLQIPVENTTAVRISKTFDDLPEDLLGLYIGASIENAAAGDGPLLPDRVLIFRRNLCEMCESREELADEIRITVLHEIGHHFGLDEEALDELGYG